MKNITTSKSFPITSILIKPLIKSYYQLYKFLKPETPWLPIKTIRFLDKQLTANMTGFEFGSGSSTLYFSNKIKQLESVEHSEEWFKRISTVLEQTKRNNIHLHYIKENINSNSPENEQLSKIYAFDPSFTIKFQYYNYFSFITKFPDEYFDFIIIDGRGRVECAFNSEAKLKKGGFLILNNSERTRYKAIFGLLSAWKKIYSTTGLTDSTIFVKPN